MTLLAPTYPTDENPIRFANGTCSYNSVALKTEQVTVASNNQFKMREDPTNIAGYCNAVVVDRKPQITANPESQLVATRDVYGQWIGHTEAAFDLQLDGTSTSTIDIDAPKAQIVSAQEADRERIVTDDIQWNCQKNGTTKDRALTITFNETA